MQKPKFDHVKEAETKLENSVKLKMCKRSKEKPEKSTLAFQDVCDIVCSVVHDM